MNKALSGKAKIFWSLVVAAGLAQSIVPALNPWMSVDATHFLRGMLIGLAIVFLAAATRVTASRA